MAGERAVPGVKTTTSTSVVDYVALGQHVADALPDDQAAFLDGFAAIYLLRQPSPVAGLAHLQHVADEVYPDRRGPVALVLAELVAHIDIPDAA